MTDEAPSTAMNADEQALDAALTQALRAPSLPLGFRNHLQAALIRATAAEHAERRRLDDERREWLAKLEVDYLRLRRRTLGTLIGSAFAAGVVVMLLLPWFNATFGANAMFALASSGALAGIVIGATTCLRRLGLANPLELL